MALGLTLMDDAVAVFFLDKRFDLTEADSINKELMEELEVKFFSNHEGNAETELVSTEHVARVLIDCDHVLPY